MSLILPPGEVIPGTRYRVLEKVAEGAMGAVYAAEHVDLEKRVALKTLLAEIAHSPDSIERFRQEAKAASKIGSPFICDVTDFGELPNGQVFFVMEYLKGESLADVIDAEGTLDPGRSIAILRQTCKALGAAHEKGIVHLDVKPDNIMLVADRRRKDGVKIVDFGVAGLVHESGAEDRIAGTPEYIAPERALGKGYDHRSDIYSLGIVAYEMLTGRPPFEGEHIIDTLKRHVNEKPEPMGKRAPDRSIPSAFESVVMQMIAKDPSQRPQRMEVVEAMLCEAQIAAGLRTEWDHLDLPPVDDAWQKKLAERMPSARGRQRRGLLIAALALAVVAAGVAVYFGVFREPEIRVVQVAVTETEEAETVARFLEQADQAARAAHYTRPQEGSALDDIEKAEAEARKAGRKSAGAERLRKAYASALTVTGNELSKAGLRELAVKKFKEALAFAPTDGDLAKKSEASAEERQQLVDPEKRRAARVKKAAPAEEANDAASDLAADLFLAAQHGRYSEARLSAKQLGDIDKNGAVRAHVADAVRKLAGAAWDRGDRRIGRSLYQLVLDLDPADLEAQSRSRLELDRPPEVAAATPPPPPPPPPEPEDTKHKHSKKPGKIEEKVQDEPVSDTPRNDAAAQAAVQDGERALKQGRLNEAESAFNRGVRADPLSPQAVGGLAEVAFERAQYTEALDYARRASRLGAKSPKYQMILGDAYFKLLRYTDAKTAYEKAQALAGKSDSQIGARLERVKAKLAQ